MKNLKYWLLIIFFSIVPTIVLHLMVKPLWTNKMESFMTGAAIDGVLTVFFLPIYLTILNYYLAKKYRVNPFLFIVNTIIILFCIWLSTYLGFQNWANSIGNELNPDNGTLEVIGFERTLGYIVSVILLIIAFVNLKNRMKYQAE